MTETTSAGRRMPRGARAIAIVGALAAMLALSGCVPEFLSPNQPVSTPTGEEVAADLEPFYTQVLEWERCGDGMGCATAKAPSTGATRRPARPSSPSYATWRRVTSSAPCS